MINKASLSLSWGLLARTLLSLLGAWLGIDALVEVPLITPAIAQDAGREWESAIDVEAGRDAHRLSLDAFVAPLSINKDQQVSIYVRSPEAFRLRVYRLGWYDGNGALLVHDQDALVARNHAPSFRCGRESADPAVRQADLDYGLLECRWADPVVISIPDQSPGLYLARITALINGADRNNIALFTVRDDASSERLVVLNPTTMQAYNDWSDTPDPTSAGGFLPRGMYTEPSRMAKVSFNRPFTGLPGFLKNDYPLVRYLEREEIPYSLATDYDLHAKPELLNDRRSVVISGHGEYWSWETRGQLDQFLATGRNIVAMSANSGYWQIRYEASPVGLPGQVVTGYKESALHTGPVDMSDPLCATIIVPASSRSCGDPLLMDTDPGNDYLATTQFRNHPVNLPEQLLWGVQFQMKPAAAVFEIGVTLFTDEIAALQSTGTGIAAAGHQTIGVSAPDNSATILGNIGHEGDAVHPHVLLLMRSSACLRQIGEATWSVDEPNENELGNYKAHMVLYQPKEESGHVFSGLSMLWSWGLDDWATMKGMGGARVSRVDSMLQTLTKNMLRAAEQGSFGSDCPSPIDLSFFFADVSLDTIGAELLIKENDQPGRWAVVPLGRTANTGVVVKPVVNATADLSGWALISDAYDLFTADVNGDGLADLIAKEKNQPGNWDVALTDGHMFHPQPTWLSGWASASAAYDLFAADVNGDGRADLIAKEKGAPGNWYVALSNGNSFHPQPTWLSGWASASAAYDLFAADVNGDGRA
ncbi:N,N-dimethylformamidase beta subunit family domain-containing protein, partial [Skermanella aerolata]|uniref:VCBS repeat-containing protein n=1 Tax=Skermanella aerolata TaxID=393310 RepID=UPI003D191916